MKRVLLQYYKLSPESFLKLFGGTSKKDEETHLQFHERLNVIFDKWIHMAGVETTFDALKQAIIRE